MTKTAAGMASLEKALPDALDLSRPRIVPMQARGVHWLPVIRSLCSTIDAFDCDAARLIAASCGLTRMATLIPEYAARFGERPSDTLRGRGG